MRHAAAITADSWREVGTIPWYGPEHCLNDRVVCTMLRSFRGAADVLARPVHAEDLPFDRLVNDATGWSDLTRRYLPDEAVLRRTLVHDARAHLER